jgi:predicted DNA-binding transcriptional regulator AlpA
MGVASVDTVTSRSAVANRVCRERLMIMTESNVTESAPDDPTVLWTIDDVSKCLRVPVATLYQWRVRGEGPPALRLGRHLRYVPASVRAWALAQLAA